MDQLGRYYTQESISNVLVKYITIETAKSVVDLGVGDGSLIRAASRRWADAHFYGADVDINRKRILIKSSKFKVYTLDCLLSDFPNRSNIEINSIDVAICNPPYLRVPKTEIYDKLFLEVDLEECLLLNRVTTDIIFLAQNLKLLKPGGELGIILPDGLLTNFDFQQFRKALLKNYRIISIIQLPEKIFKSTEARTHILIIRKEKPSSAKIPLLLVDVNGNCKDYIKIEKSALEHRMDYRYHKWVKDKSLDIANSYTLSEINADIRRGTYPEIKLKTMELKYFHTTSFPNSNQKIRIPNFSIIQNAIWAKSGDILMARVGKGCIGKVTLIEEGKILLSDCVYRIRVSQFYSEMLYSYLVSSSGQESLKALSHGVCAKVISKKDLLNHPILFEVDENSKQSYL